MVAWGPGSGTAWGDCWGTADRQDRPHRRDAEILGVTHLRASVIARGADFPRPLGREGQSRLWDRREVTALAKVWRREKPWR
jgi:hypothetical protein